MEKGFSHTFWSLPPDLLGLQPRQVDIWRIPLDLPPVAIKSLESLLSTDEAQRAARFHFPRDRDRFIASHGCLREILSSYLSCKPSQLNFSANEYGKPALQDHPLEFNLSHSGDFALIAVTREHKVGVDVERIRTDLELERIANRFFSPNEVSELVALPNEQREVAFFTCWTRKEAYIKAQGLGLSLPLKSFDVSLSPNEPARLRATRPDPQEAARWTLFPPSVGSRYLSAVAVDSQDIEFRLWDRIID